MPPHCDPEVLPPPKLGKTKAKNMALGSLGSESAFWSVNPASDIQQMSAFTLLQKEQYFVEWL